MFIIILINLYRFDLISGMISNYIFIINKRIIFMEGKCNMLSGNIFLLYVIL